MPEFSLLMAKEETCNVDGLAAEWDTNEEIREMLRNGKALIAEVSEKQVDIQCAATYRIVLEPILVRMSQNKKKLPTVDGLKEEVSAVLELNKRDPAISDVVKFSWLLRKNLGFVKMKCRRREVSIDPLLGFGVLFRN